MNTSDEHRKAYIASVIKEREVYKQEDNGAGVEACDAELSRYEAKRETPRRTAARRTGRGA